MTKEEAIIRLKEGEPFSEIYDPVWDEALKMAISALSENKGEWLDKIRAEIESQRKEVSKKQSEDDGLSNYYFGLNDGLKDARDILDKYKAESEE